MSWLAILPYAFQVIGWLLNRYNASEETKKKFIALVQSSKDDGLIAVSAKDEFARQKEELLKGGTDASQENKSGSV